MHEQRRLSDLSMITFRCFPSLLIVKTLQERSLNPWMQIRLLRSTGSKE